jgi:hypothetical protein
MDQEGLAGLDSFTLARTAAIEAKRRAVTPPTTPPPAPTPRDLREADQARAFQAAWPGKPAENQAGARGGRKAGTCVPRSMWSSGM